MDRICDYCGKEFDEQDAREVFEIETMKNYNYLTKSLCAECAIEAIDDMVDGIYYEECENCHSRFDPFADEIELQQQTGDSGAEIDMFGRYLCLNCSLAEYMDMNENEDEYEECESISVYDAALIWISHGKDENYTFGYSEDELEGAL